MYFSIIDPCFAKVDLVFILDSSTSVGNDNYDKMKDFVKKFLHSANIDNGEVRVGLLSYSTNVKVEFQLNSYGSKTEVFDAVDAVPWRYGSTNTADGLKTMHAEMFTEANGDRPGVPNICIIMTDGVSNINYQRTIPEAVTAREKGIHIYAIGIALKDLREVNGIASEPASLNVFAVDSFDELEGLDERIFEATCPGNSLSDMTLNMGETFSATGSNVRCSRSSLFFVAIFSSSIFGNFSFFPVFFSVITGLVQTHLAQNFLWKRKFIINCV